MIPSKIQFLVPKHRNKTFFWCCLKQFQYARVMFYENSFIAAAFTIKLQVINANDLKKPSEW